MDLTALKKLWQKLNLTIPQLTIIAAVVFIFGLMLLSFTFIIPVLAIAAALLIIVFVIYIIYKFLGGK